MQHIQQLINQKSQLEPGMPLVMGILNVTPDSFSDGGQYQDVNSIDRQVEKMVAAGVDIIDIGGESTRPGAQPVNLQAELERVLPAIERVKANSDVLISIDTYKPEVMKQAIEMGAGLVNDVNALQAEGAVELVAQHDVSVCLMHKQGVPQCMQNCPTYENVVDEVIEFLLSRADLCQKAGIEQGQIMIDPGFGFGKSLQHNIALFEQLDQFVSTGYPVLVGVSRKSMIGQILGDLPVEQRMVGSVSAAVVAALKGAKVIRVHDVPETVQALKVAMSLL